MPYLSPTLSNRRRYSDLVRAESPLARENYYAKKRRDLEEERLATEKSLATQQLTQQQAQFEKSLAEMQSQYKGSLAEGTRQHEETLAEMKREYEEGLAEQNRQHQETLASEKTIADKSYELSQQAQKQAGKQADIASGIGLAGLGIEAYPVISNMFGGGAAASAAAGSSALGAPAAAGYTATGGAGTGASTLAGSSGTTAAGGMGALAGSATAVGVPLAIAIMSGHFKQLGKKDTPGIDELWHTYTPEQKEAFVNSGNLNAQQLQWVAYNDTDFYKTHPEMQNQLRQNVMTEESGRPGSYSFSGPAWAGVSDEEKSRLRKDLTKEKHATRMKRFDDS